ncbi:cinnamoyl-CoA reductase-like SNL6 isoform X1 [Manihot esculenta]|uniref:3-beta hydroxysteroid dehydrogenase/isomerase domain-containing protein n=1 Tax=Manihot esculenta TaxID=3983 RepID=A0A2C9U7A9_MANES|nr:cinnamoyl-CoA reductase-like SNL6 isoform X1 [Manihot esculenta]OAY25737.1 hypothetical protein MANES_17G115900v8 [Manihot esculenta]
MGFIESEERRFTEMEELKRLLVACAGLGRRKDQEDFQGSRFPSEDFDVEDDGAQKLVCVTSGVSFLGLAIVNRLLRRGYSVRIIVHTEEEMEKVREVEGTNSNNSIKAVMAKLTQIESLLEAFEGCRGVFHTASFTDPAGLSGYSKSMAEIEEKGSENVIMACSRTPSVRNCVLTSSLLACVWRDASLQELSSVINHDSWSDESLCMDNKLWYALGKLRAERAAWRIAKETGLKLVTICPALITGPHFIHSNPTATIAYLKGAEEMFRDGVLATADVMKLAEAHACLMEAMDKTAFGRYIYFDNVIKTQDEAEELATMIGMPASKISGNVSMKSPAPFELSNKKILTLMSTALHSCYKKIRN